MGWRVLIAISGIGCRFGFASPSDGGDSAISIDAPSIGAASVSVVNHQVDVALTPSTSGYNGITSAALLDVSGDSTAAVEVAQATSSAGWVETNVYIAVDSDNLFLLHTGSGSFLARAR